MKKKSFFILIFLFFFVLSFSNSFSEKIRYIAIASMQKLFIKKSPIKNLYESRRNLKVENELLKEEKKKIYEWLMFERRIEEQIQKLQDITKAPLNKPYWKKFFQRRSEEIKKILKMQLQALPAKVIYREPSSWSSSIWVNVGEKNNIKLKKTVIGKNSPVVVDDSLVGVVEHVGENFSRIRLITDSGLFPSVRAVRGKGQDEKISQVATLLYEMIQTREDLIKEEFLSLLSQLIKKLKEKEVDYYLAKGQINGSSNPLWRSYGQKLKGTGFNYDFKDKEGPARNLISGKILKGEKKFLSKPIIKKGDLLVTTGMDGVFPKGLKVGMVSKVENLKDTDSFYNIEAISNIKNLNSLSIVFILPPLSFQKD